MLDANNSLYDQQKNEIVLIKTKYQNIILIKARKYLNRRIFLNIYYTFAYPYLSYCVEIWGNAYNIYFLIYSVYYIIHINQMLFIF